VQERGILLKDLSGYMNNLYETQILYEVRVGQFSLPTFKPKYCFD